MEEWEYFLNKAIEATDGQAVKIDGYDDCIIGTTDRGGCHTVLRYSFARMLEKYVLENDIKEDPNGFDFAQAMADVWEMTGDRQNDFGVYSPIVVDDL